MLKIAIIVAVIGSSIWVWEEVLEDRIIPKRWGVVAPGEVYRSWQLSPALFRQTLDKHGIGLVVHLGVHNPDNAAHVAEQEAVALL